MRIRESQLVKNAQDINKKHTPFVFLEKQGQLDEAYRHIDCILVTKDKDICENCEKLRKTMQQIRRRFLVGVNPVKTIHASKNILIEKVEEQRKVIQTQNITILNIKEHLQKKVEKEKIEVSNTIADVISDVTKSVSNKNIDISNLHPIFQELIRIQIGKPKGTRYHPM